MPHSNRPTHGIPLTEAERNYPRGAAAGQKSWQGGPRYQASKRAGLYASHTGNTNGTKKQRRKDGPKTPNAERPVRQPGWARKYRTQEVLLP